MRYWAEGPTEARIRWRRVVAILFALVVVASGLAWIGYDRATDPGPAAAALDKLRIPSSWTLARTDVVRSLILGSRVERYYLVDADPDDLVAPVTSMIESAGFTLDVWRAPRDWCDNRPLGASPEITCPEKLHPPCSTNGEGGPMTCNVHAFVGSDRLSVLVLDRGERASIGYGSASGFLEDPVRIVVRVMLDY